MPSGNWLVVAKLVGHRWTAVSQPRPFGIVDDGWHLVCALGGSAAALAGQLGSRATEGGLPRRIQLDSKLLPVLRPGGGGRISIAGLPHFDKAVLLAGAGTAGAFAAIARLSDPVLGVSQQILGEREGMTAIAEFAPLRGSAEIATDGAARRTDYVGPLRLRIRSQARDEFVVMGTEHSRLILTEVRGAPTVLRLDLRLNEYATAVETRHGRFDVFGEAMELKAEGQRIQSFAANASLAHFSIRLPVSTSLRQGFADVGRLDFRQPGPRCTFTWVGLPPTTGATFDAVVRLGPQSASVAPVRIMMDKASLTTIRERDLLRLRFGFSQVMLEAGRGAPRLILRQSLESAACSAEPPPCLIVEFPPQHVMERGFARQLASFAEPAEVLTEIQTKLDPAGHEALRKTFSDGSGGGGGRRGGCAARGRPARRRDAGLGR